MGEVHAGVAGRCFRLTLFFPPPEVPLASTIDTLSSQAESVHARYRRAFAGKNRATRDLTSLDEIVADMKAVSVSVPESASQLRAAVDEWLRLYNEERAAIARIQAGGPAAVQAWRLVEWGEVTFLRYLRDFAGHNRTTRDNWLLAEMANRQGTWLSDLNRLVDGLNDETLNTQRDQATKNLDLYRTEGNAIPNARVGLAPNDHARLLATLANTQFGLYRRHFVTRPRNSRRPALLKRMIGALEDIQGRMEAVRSLGVNTQVHLENMTKVKERIHHHKNELQAIEAARNNTSPDQLARALGDDANTVFNDYRTAYANKPRNSVDNAQLGELCDRLHEIAAAMYELQSERPTDTNAKNLTVVIETVKGYEREYKAIDDAKKNN